MGVADLGKAVHGRDTAPQVDSQWQESLSAGTGNGPEMKVYALKPGPWKPNDPNC